MTIKLSTVIRDIVKRERRPFLLTKKKKRTRRGRDIIYFQRKRISVSVASTLLKERRVRNGHKTPHK